MLETKVRKRVMGILAVSSNMVIGQGEFLPWTHKQDLQRFKSLTMNHAILIGYPTFLGIIKYYSSLSLKPAQIFPGRDVFVVGRHPMKEPNHNFDLSNICFIETQSPRDDLKKIVDELAPSQDLFIAGGRRIYRDYLRFASKVYLTKIDSYINTDHNTVYLDPDTIELLDGLNLGPPVHWRSVVFEGCDNYNGLEANYFVLDAMV